MKSNMKKFLALFLSLSLVLATFGDFAQVKAADSYIDVTLTGLHGNTSFDDANQQVVLWFNITGGFWTDPTDWSHQWEQFVYEVNGVEKRVNIVQSAGPDLLYVTIPYSDVSPTVGNKITIKKGEYAATAIETDPDIHLQNDFEIVFTCDRPVVAESYKVFDAEGATIINGTSTEIWFSLLDKNNNPITLGHHTGSDWNSYALSPADAEGGRFGSTDWSSTKNGVFQKGSHIKYWATADGNNYNAFKEVDNGQFWIGDINAQEGTTVTVKGAFVNTSVSGAWSDVDKCIFKEFSFTYTNGTWVFSKPYQDVTLKNLYYDKDENGADIRTRITSSEVQLWLNINSGAWSNSDWKDWESKWYKFVYEINGVKKNVATVQAAGANLLYVTIALSDISTEAGTKITIKAGEYPAYENTNMGINLLNDFEIVFTCDEPVVAADYKVFELGSATVVPGTETGTTGFQFTLTDKNGNAFTSGYFTNATDDQWNERVLCPANEYGNREDRANWSTTKNGVFQDGNHIDYFPNAAYNFQEINEGKFYIGGLNATNGTKVTVKGAFAVTNEKDWNDVTPWLFEEFSFTYTNGAWVSSTTSTEPEPSYTEYTGTPEFESSNGTDGFYFTAGETEFPYDATNESVVATAAEEEGSGVFLNGEKTSVNLKKVDQDRWYVCLGDAGIVLEDGDEITIVGSFIYQTHKITFTKYTYVYEEPAQNHTGTPVLAENDEYGLAKGFYFTSEDGAPHAEDWSLDFTALDGDENGVLVNGTKTTIILKKVGTNLWYVCIGDANVTLNYGDVVTIKGAFQVGDTSDTVTFNEATFEFNGKHFGEGEFTAADFTITGLAYSDIVYDAANTRWNMYFTLSTNILGDVDATYYPYMTYEIDGTEYSEHWFKSSSAHTVNGETIYNLYIPIKQLPKTLQREYVITVKAGASQGRVSGTNAAREDGIRLTEDYQFTVGGDYEASAPTIDYLMANGGNENGIYLSSADNFPTIGWDYNLTKATTEDGIVVNGATTDVFIKKYEDNKYYVCLSDMGITAQEGTVVMLRGAFTTAGLNTVTFKTAKYIFKSNQWQVYSSTEETKTTGFAGDADGSKKLTSADLVRIKKYLKDDSSNEIYMDADLNGTGKIDEKDVVLERKLLIGLIDENGAHIKGAPSYDNTTDEMRLAAYVSPTVAEGFDDYKAAGFTTLISEQRAVYGEDGFADYMNLAAEKGLDVLVQSGNLQEMLKGNVDYNPSWLQLMCDELSEYSSFRGLFMGDEPRISYLNNYTTVTNALKIMNPNMDLFTSCLPTYTDEEYLSTESSLSLEEKYANYANAYGNLFGEFTYDFYPFKHSYKSFLGIKYDEKDYMRPDWFQNLELAAKTAKGSYDTGITVQSYAENLNEKDHYRDVTKADVSFQVYSALAYGMKSINYFTYGTHWDSSVGTTSCMVYNGTKTAVYDAVKNVNTEIKAFDNVLLNYNWQGTIGISGDDANNIMDYVTSYTSKRISAYSASNDAIIGCLKDVNGYDGFMLVNTTDPSKNITETISVTFKSADHAKVYIDGVESIVELTNGTYATTLAPGQGIFVIPYIQ